MIEIKSVAPARERGLKSTAPEVGGTTKGRSREGAWIEMSLSMELNIKYLVAPARERGLKSLSQWVDDTGLKSLPRGSVD